MYFLKRFKYLILIILSLCIAIMVITESFFSDDDEAASVAKVTYISDFQENQQLFINAKVDIKLSSAIRLAIQHEIPIRFKTTIILSKDWPIFGFDYDLKEVDKSYETELRYVKYTRTYTLTNFRNHQRRSFKNLNDALYTLGVIDSLPITGLVHLHPGVQYQIKARINLMTWKLPSPLIITALTAPKWQFGSKCLIHNIKAPTSW